MEQLLTTGDVALMLGRSVEGVRLLERRGELRAIRTPRGLRLFERAEVEALAAARKGQVQ